MKPKKLLVLREDARENIVHRAHMIQFKLAKFISRYELEPIYSVDGKHKFHYVIDIYHSEDKFFPKVQKRDYFCIYPTGINELCEEKLTCFDSTEEWEKFFGASEDDVLQKVLSKIKDNYP